MIKVGKVVFVDFNDTMQLWKYDNRDYDLYLKGMNRVHFKSYWKAMEYIRNILERN